MFLYVSIFLFLLLIFFGYTVVLSLKRINQYEDILISIQNIIEQSTNKLKLIDDRGTFESDDEVGFFFEELKSIQSVLDNIFEIEGEEADAS